MEQQYQSAEYVVVFMDILGAKDKIANGGDEVLNIIHRAYDQMMDALDGLFAGTATRPIKPKVKIFSDNIAICFPVAPREKYKAFVAAALSSAFIQNQFLYNGYLLRGGIAIGKCYIDETMIWGNALVNAFVNGKVVDGNGFYSIYVLEGNTVSFTVTCNHTYSDWTTQSHNPAVQERKCSVCV